MKPLARLAAGLLAGFLLALAWHLKHPLMYGLRHVETPLLLTVAIGGLIALRRGKSKVMALLLIAVLLTTLYREIEYRLEKAAVLAGGEAMRSVGAHMIVGYTDFDEIRTLTAQGLIGGIYLGKRNLRGRSLYEVAAEIDALQTIRQRAELPPLIVAGDQEGGTVSHLSPLLERMPPLASLTGSDDPWRCARHYGLHQGRGLAGLGINLNFGPVVDLRPAGPDNPHDRLTRISARAIAADPATVGTIAAGYIDGLNERGVRTTLKHFPGLGRVSQDTHLRAARLDGDLSALRDDWQPFRQLAGQPGTAIMLAHVKLSELDAQRASSHSAAVVDGLLRNDWGYDGVLITDDLNMGAVYDLGIGRVAGEALTAGVDLVLVSYDPRQIYRAIYGAARQLASGELPDAQLRRSKTRLAEFIPHGETPGNSGSNAKIAAPVSFRCSDAPADSRFAARKPPDAG